jgi:hypothetical protein
MADSEYLTANRLTLGRSSRTVFSLSRGRKQRFWPKHNTNLMDNIFPVVVFTGTLFIALPVAARIQAVDEAITAVRATVTFGLAF